MSGEGAMQYSQSSRPAAAAQCRLASRFTPVEKQCGTAVHSRSDDATSDEICACTHAGSRRAGRRRGEPGARAAHLLAHAPGHAEQGARRARGTPVDPWLAPVLHTF